MHRSGLRTLFGAVTIAAAMLGATSAVDAQVFTFMSELVPADVVPPPTVVSGTNPHGLAVIKLTLVKNFSNNVTAATVDYNVGLVGFDSPDAVTGVEIGEAPAGSNDSVIAESGITPGSPVELIDGKAFLNRPNRSTPFLFSAGQIPNNPSGFFLRVKTASNPNGAVRGQLRSGTFQGVGGSVFTNARSYAGGALFRLGALLGNVGPDIEAQIFAGLILSAELGAAACPGPGNLALIFFGPGGTFAQECLASLSSSPLAFTTLNIPANSTVQEIPIVEFTMPSGLPTGTSHGFICYKNPQGQPPQPVCDTSAFATNP